ncbi:GreA/GreB family elongation factor [Deinococcus sp. QL22]|uniref:GreA/GreB family elongation factor n=1 Tax=Deinococcus sp. QL22 TaxID=2939437 RepID=UPI0020173137|nr:GreA/GreB family elongation factor [Deinococcus sp. QL22]UQN09110.1 GreA/GreB family elongation factor [Deinococcus sp. QL22]
MKITAAGWKRLQQSLEREQERLEEARAYVRDQMEANEAENLGLVEAQQQLAAVEERIEELRSVLDAAQVISVEGGQHDCVELGDYVLLKDLQSGRELRAQLVSPVEVAPTTQGVVQISSDSPVGRKLEGAKAGDSFEVTVGRRQAQYQVHSIETKA